MPDAQEDLKPGNSFEVQRPVKTGELGFFLFVCSFRLKIMLSKWPKLFHQAVKMIKL